ncbi:hypothetical protein MAR_038037, partial [Mya arenaria]
GYSSHSHAVSPYITLSILVAGIVGGLIIVVAFILFCKYCVKRKGTLRRAQTVNALRSDVSRPFNGMRRSTPTYFLSPARDRWTEYRSTKGDFLKPTAFCETTVEPERQDQCEPEVLEGATSHVSETREIEEPTGRRVSFQLDNLSTTPTGYLRKGRRYTDGDFHYLKRARISKHTPPRQTSFNPSVTREREIYSRETNAINAASNSGYYKCGPCAQGGDECHPPFTHEYVLDSPSSNHGETDILPKILDVDVEVHGHFELSNANKECRSSGNLESQGYTYGHYSRRQSKIKDIQPTSYSMDGASPRQSRSQKDKRRVKSYDDVFYHDYDVLKITEFSRGPYFNSEFDPIMEVENLASSKVRYNDMGSLEILNEDKLEMYDEYEFENNIIPDESDADTETTINGTQKFREIWNLRATFEEEEECSDTLRMEDMASPEESSPERSQGGHSYSPTYHKKNCSVNPNTCSGTNSPSPRRRRSDAGPSVQYVDPLHVDPEDSNLLHPNYENRRDDFRKVVNRRYQKRGSTSAENSFDSVETGDTDGDATESSRHEVTTSFESTTDNTDSTNDSQTSRLRQMKADSGYKSLETPHPPVPTNGAKKAHSLDDEILVLGSEITHQAEVLEAVGANESVPRRCSLFEKRRGRTASKRRREYSRDRQVVRLNESVHEPETDSTRSDQPSGSSLEEPSTPNTKMSVFSRFFKSHKSRTKSLSRDFSIDEKSNNMFQEFIRYDPKYEEHRGSTAGLEKRRHRLQRKFTDPGPGFYYEDRKWLSPEMRSISLGSDSSASSARKISPQDSIEEQYEEEDIDAAVQHHKNRIIEEHEHVVSVEVTSHAEVTTPNVSVHEIPIIKLPEGESVDVDA